MEATWFEVDKENDNTVANQLPLALKAQWTGAASVFNATEADRTLFRPPNQKTGYRRYEEKTKPEDSSNENIQFLNISSEKENEMPRFTSTVKPSKKRSPKRGSLKGEPDSKRPRKVLGELSVTDLYGKNNVSMLGDISLESFTDEESSGFLKSFNSTFSYEILQKILDSENDSKSTVDDEQKQREKVRREEEEEWDQAELKQSRAERVKQRRAYRLERAQRALRHSRSNNNIAVLVDTADYKKRKHEETLDVTGSTTSIPSSGGELIICTDVSFDSLDTNESLPKKSNFQMRLDNIENRSDRHVENRSTSATNISNSDQSIGQYDMNYSGIDGDVSLTDEEYNKSFQGYNDSTSTKSSEILDIYGNFLDDDEITKFIQGKEERRKEKSKQRRAYHSARAKSAKGYTNLNDSTAVVLRQRDSTRSNKRNLEETLDVSASNNSAASLSSIGADFSPIPLNKVQPSPKRFKSSNFVKKLKNIETCKSERHVGNKSTSTKNISYSGRGNRTHESTPSREDFGPSYPDENFSEDQFIFCINRSLCGYSVPLLPGTIWMTNLANQWICPECSYYGTTTQDWKNCPYIN